ncbi:MAG: glycosyltransferase family 2 protein [Alphaproteobacteria bacterium]
MLDKKTPSVSVVMSVYNGGDFLLPNGIGSILKQTFQDFEFIIIDDGSVDGSDKIIREAAKKDKRIRPIFLSENVGPARARNAGFALACGKYMMVHEACDISYPERIEKQFNFMEANPDFVLVGSAMREINLTQNIDGDYYSSGENNGRGVVLSYANEPQKIHDALMQGAMPSTGLVFFVRMTALRKIGGYHPALVVAEDMDLFFRLYLYGKIGSLREPLVEHILHNDNSLVRLPLFKGTCALAASQSHLSRLVERGELMINHDTWQWRLGNKPDILLGREIPPELEILELSSAPADKIALTQYIMEGLLAGVDREKYYHIFFQLLNNILTMDLPPLHKIDFIFYFIWQIMHYKRGYYLAHYKLLRQLVERLLAISRLVNDWENKKLSIKKFLDSKQQDSSWLDKI